MAVSSSLLKTNLNISKISSSVFNTNKKLDETGNTALKINTTLLKRNKEKRKNIAQDEVLFARKREATRRREKESVVEASRIGGVFQRQKNIIAESTKGFLGRILDFAGTLLTGWLLNNLPTIIGLAQELIARIQRFVSILGSFITGATKIFTSLGSSVGAIFSDIRKFQFTFPQTRMQIDKTMFELEDAFSQFSNSFDEAIKLFTTPFGQEGEGSYSGEPIPEPGSTWSGTPPESGGGGGADPTDLKSGAKLLMQKGFPAKGAAYLAGNIQQESGWKAKRKPWVLSDGAGTNKGLISWNRTRITAAEKFLGKPLETASASEQIDWIKEEMRQYGVLKTFMNPNATDEQLKKASYGYIVWRDEGDRWKYSQVAYDYLQKEGSKPPAPPATTPPSPGSESTTAESRTTPTTVGASTSSTALAKSAERLKQQRLDTSRYGRDGCVYAVNEVYKSAGMTPPWGTSVYVPTARGVLVKKGWKQVGVNGARPGDIVIMLDKHPTEPWIHIGIVSTKGTVIHNSSTNRALTNDEPFSSLTSRYVKIEVFRDPAAGVAAPPTTANPSRALPAQALMSQVPNQAQITPPSRQAASYQSLAQERRGPVVMLSQQQAPPTPPMMGGQGSSMSLPQGTPDTLNRYITQKLLLELAYT